MKTKSIIHVLSVLLAIPLTGMLARAESITIDVLETFDYPAGTGTLTEPQKINSHNEIAGIFIVAWAATPKHSSPMSGSTMPRTSVPHHHP